MKKGFDSKKGQGLDTTTLVILIMSGVVLVVGVLFFTGGFGYIADKMGLLPDDLTTASTVCEQYSGSDALKISYCEFRELRIEGKKGYYNCDAVRAAAIKITPDLEWSSPGCGTSTGATFCTQLSQETGYKESTIVNGKPCNAVGGTDSWNVPKPVAAA